MSEHADSDYDFGTCCPECGGRVKSNEWDGRCRRCGTGQDEYDVERARVACEKLKARVESSPVIRAARAKADENVAAAVAWRRRDWASR